MPFNLHQWLFIHIRNRNRNRIKKTKSICCTWCTALECSSLCILIDMRILYLQHYPSKYLCFLYFYVFLTAAAVAALLTSSKSPESPESGRKFVTSTKMKLTSKLPNHVCVCLCVGQTLPRPLWPEAGCLSPKLNSNLIELQKRATPRGRRAVPLDW